MIEIRNVKIYANEKARSRNEFNRMHVWDVVEACACIDFPEDSGCYMVKLCLQASPNVPIEFETFEKAEAFYSALKLIKTIDAPGITSIDVKEYE